MDKRRERASRKRQSFRDDDSFDNFPDPHPKPSAPMNNFGGTGRHAETVEAVVSWFKADKGFGFVVLSDGSGDAFLHIRAVEAAGLDDLPPQTKLRVEVGQGQKGKQVNSIVEVIELGGGSPQPIRSSEKRKSFAPGRPDPSNSIHLAGTVKWFNRDKGFGFVATGDGGKDVFVHISVVEQAGLSSLDEGQRVLMQVGPGKKGREAVSIQIE